MSFIASLAVVFLSRILYAVGTNEANTPNCTPGSVKGLYDLSVDSGIC